MQNTHNPKIQTHILNSRLLQIQHYFLKTESEFISDQNHQNHHLHSLRFVNNNDPLIFCLSYNRPGSKIRNPKTKNWDFFKEIWIGRCAEKTPNSKMESWDWDEKEQDTRRISSRENMSGNWKGENEEDFGWKEIREQKGWNNSS